MTEGHSIDLEDRPRKQLSALKGFLVVLGAVLATQVSAVVCSLVLGGAFAIISLIGLGSHEPVKGGGAFIGLLLLLTLSISLVAAPFLLGRLVGKYGWLVGLAYSLPLVTGVAFWMLAAWGGRNSFRRYWILLPIMAAVAVGVTEAGSRKRGKRLPLHLEKPLSSLVPVALCSVVISALLPLIGFLVEFNSADPAKIVKEPKYYFEVLKPRGWTMDDYASKAYIKDLTENIEGEFELQAYHDYADPPTGGVTILVFDKMPYTGVPIADFSSDDEAYEYLRSLLQAVVDHPQKFPSGRGSEIKEYEYYGETAIDGLKAIRVGYIEYAADHPGGKPSIPKTSAYGDIVVFRRPFLYWLDMHDANPRTPEKRNAYNLVKDTFRFLPVPAAEGGVPTASSPGVQPIVVDAQKYTWTCVDGDPGKAGTGSCAFSSISALDSGHVWVTRPYGYIRFFDGSTWTKQYEALREPQPGTVTQGGDELHSIYALDAGHVWASGTSGIYFFDGSSWIKQYVTQLNPAGYLEYNPVAFSGIDSSHVWNACGYNARKNSSILFFNGSSWVCQGDVDARSLTDIVALDKNNVWAVGGWSEWERITLDGPEKSGRIYHFDGTSWSLQYEADAYLIAVFAADANHVWAISYDKIYFFNGSTWVEQASSESMMTNETFVGGFAFDGADAWIAGVFGGLYSFDGSSWKHQFESDSGMNRTIKHISAAGPDCIWAISDNAVYRGQYLSR